MSKGDAEMQLQSLVMINFPIYLSTFGIRINELA